jgi:hypothetical protein
MHERLLYYSGAVFFCGGLKRVALLRFRQEASVAVGVYRWHRAAERDCIEAKLNAAGVAPVTTLGPSAPLRRQRRR